MSDQTVKLDPARMVDCWEDEERMNFLFSAFPPTRSINPHHWDTKLTFWKNLIHDMSVHNSYGYVTWENLFSRLERRGKYPLGLQVVFEDLIASGEIVPTAQYTQDIKANESWVGWGLKWCVKKPVIWMADKVLSPIKSRPDRDLKKGQFVHVSALEKKCGKVVSKFHVSVSDKKQDYDFLNIISYTRLREMVKDILCDSESVDLALATLRKNKIVAIWSPGEPGERLKDETSKERYIKFAKKNETTVDQFSEVDVGIVRLCETKTNLNHLIDTHYEEIEQCTQKARECLKNDQRTMAKNALRRRKRIEASLEKKEQALSNVEELLESLHQCKTDKMVMDTYKQAVTAYKDASHGLSSEEVQETMDDVSSVLDTQAEVTEMLSGPATLADSDTLDLEAELTTLLELQAEDESVDYICSKMNGVKIDESLPDVPQHIPKSIPSPKKDAAML